MHDTLVVKCGGNAAVDAPAICRDVGRLARDGYQMVLVHGGSADIDRLAARLGVKSRRLVALDGVSARYTDKHMLEVVHMALAGLTKPRLVSELVRSGVLAVGLTGLDGGLLRARRKAVHRAVVDGRRVVIRDDHSGRITGVNDQLLRALLAVGQLPVVSPPAMAEDGHPVNVDADRAAAAVAVGLAATTLILLTGAPGVLANPNDETSMLTCCAVPTSGPPPIVAPGMGLKLVAAREALLGGVGRVLVADGRLPDPVRAALDGSATEVILDESMGSGRDDSDAASGGVHRVVKAAGAGR